MMEHRGAAIVALMQVGAITTGSLIAKLGVELIQDRHDDPPAMTSFLAFYGWTVLLVPLVWLIVYLISNRKGNTGECAILLGGGAAFAMLYGLMCLGALGGALIN